MHYGMNFAAPDDLEPTVQELMPALLATRAASAEAVTIWNNERKLKVMEMLSQSGYVERTGMGVDFTRWKMTSIGERSIKSLTTLSSAGNVVKVCAPRGEKIGLDQWTTWEFLKALADDGWRCLIKPRRNSDLPSYTRGSPKSFFLSLRATSIRHNYLWALYVADRCDRILHHLQLDKYYKAYIAGVEYRFDTI